mgnify:CR=1 FL=1
MKQLLFFTANWCPSCQTTKPIVEQLQKTRTIPVQIIDTDYDGSLTTQYGVRSIPTLILLENGTEKKRTTGALRYEQLNQFING